MTHPYLYGLPTPRVFAHRGLVTAEMTANRVVENSVAAIAAAHAAGVHYVETDARVTSDGLAVLVHDENLSRILGDPRPVAEVHSGELAEMFAGRGGLAVLQDVIVDFPTLRFNIDVKSIDAAQAVGEAVRRHTERVLLTSFDGENRRRAVASAGRIPPAVGADVETVTKLLLAVGLGKRARVDELLNGIDAVQVPPRKGLVKVLSKRFLAEVHRAGVEVHAWTINDPTGMNDLVELGVDGIVTDVADVALKTLSR